LREQAAQFGLALVRRLAGDPGQVQLHGPFDFLSLAAGGVFADRFGGAFDRLGGHRQAGQQFQLPPPALERASWPTMDCILRTPGDASMFSMSNPAPAGNCPLWQRRHN
jgi:hypothetical protein